ncbi:hypothetical protein ACFX11_020413 [Malus domestica]
MMSWRWEKGRIRGGSRKRRREMVSGACAYPPDDVLDVEPSLPAPLISISLYEMIMMAAEPLLVKME